MQVAQAHSCGDLEKAALNFICQNLSRVSSTSSFLDLELTEVRLFFEHPKIIDILENVAFIFQKH